MLDPLDKADDDQALRNEKNLPPEACLHGHHKHTDCERIAQALGRRTAACTPSCTRDEVSMSPLRASMSALALLRHGRGASPARRTVVHRWALPKITSGADMIVCNQWR